MGRILLGANYYPEDWDESLVDSDIKKMKETGFNVVRIAEFAWKKMEPSEDEYSFEWLHRVVDKMKNAGIGVIMGTPTATPPSWLIKKHPDIAVLDATGARKSHGGRRHCCSSNPTYREYSAKIVKKLGEEFGNDDGIIGWQIDNEIYAHDFGCVCEHCVKAFHARLGEKYQDAEGVNTAWNLNLFSQAYDSIEDIPVPTNAWHNPHILLEWNISQQKNHIEFVHMQAEILRKHTQAPIGTDTMPINGIDYREMNFPLDVAQFNHYSTNLFSVTMWMDYMRKFSKIPFWNTETQPCWNGSTCQGNGLQPEGFIYMNTWLPIMLGGEANLYWLWRTHWAGHELMHGAVLDTSGRYTYAHNEIKKAADEFSRVANFLPEYKVESDCALLFTSLNWNIKLSQDINGAIDQYGYVQDFYNQLIANGIHPDLIDAREPLDSYKLLFSPTAFTLEEGNFENRVTKWVENGGVWVVGPMSDIRTSIGTKYKNSPYGFLEKLTGATLAYILPDDGGLLTLENDIGEETHGKDNYELFDVGEYEPLLRVKAGHTTLKGKCAAFAVKVGKGYVILLGTKPTDKELSRIISKAACLSNVEKYDIENKVMVTKRKRGDDVIYIAASVNGEDGLFSFDGEMYDILEEKTYTSSVTVPSFALRILKRV